MATEHLPQWPPSLSDEQLLTLSHAAVDYALSHSIVYRPVAVAGPSTTSQAPLDAAIHAPISLLPSPFPAALFKESQALQPLYNDLYARITLDDELLTRVIGGNVILVDDFQAKLWQIWKEVQREGLVQTLHLGLFRSDYLLHQEGGADGEGKPSLSIKQVELNTISSSFGPLCGRVSELHRHLARSTGAYYNASPLIQLDKLPVNKALDTLASGLAAGHQTYCKRTGTAPDAAVVLFVVQEGERNAFDQRLIEYELLEKHGVRVLRASLGQLATRATLQGDQRALAYADPTSERTEQVSVVYFRAGYGPNDYPSQREWDARLLLERSLAIKCPTTALQLAGAKKVQQVLSDEGVLESLVTDPSKGRVWSSDEVQRVRATFMPMYGMESDSQGVRIAADPRQALAYVLKPQREGGGNNVYRDAIPPTLQQLDQLDAEQGEQKTSGVASDAAHGGAKSSIKRREGYILMKLIEPPQSVGNYLVRHSPAASASAAPPKAVLASNVISELGAFGTVLFETAPRGTHDGEPTTNVVYEHSGGHLLRTKTRDSDEGGVAAGFSVIDSPLLV